MLRSLSRAGRSVSGLSLAPLSVRSTAPLASSPSTCFLRQQRWTSSSPVDASIPPAPSPEDTPETLDTSPVDSTTPTPTPSTKPTQIKKPSPLPAIIRLPPYKEHFGWDNAVVKARIVRAQMVSDAEALKLTADETAANLKLRKYLFSLVGTSEGVHRVRKVLAMAIKETVLEVLGERGTTIVVLGSIAQETDTNQSTTRLGLLGGKDLPRPETLQGRQAVLGKLIDRLKSLEITATVKGENLNCVYEGNPRSLDNPPRPIVSLSYADRNQIAKNAIYCSYTALSPAVLVPLIKTVAGVQLDGIPSTPVGREELRTILCISYLQNLPNPLLPFLQRPDLLRSFKVPTRSFIQTDVVDGKEETVPINDSFLPIGVHPRVLAREHWMNSEQELDFVRHWRKQQAPALGELAAGFFHWYGGGVPDTMFSWAKHAVSLRGLIDRTELPQFAGDAMVVLDTMNPNVNLLSKAKTTDPAPQFLGGLRNRIFEQVEVNLADLQPRPDLELTPKKPLRRPKKATKSTEKESEVEKSSESKSAIEEPLVAAAVTLEAAVPQQPEVDAPVKTDP